jgi:hypothetical protein
MSGWHELKAERNRQSLARLNKALPTIFPSGVLLRALARPFVPPTPRLAIESYWGAHPLRADRLARALAARSGAPSGWTWRLGDRGRGLPGTFRTPPSPYREREYAQGPGCCCVCGQGQHAAANQAADLGREALKIGSEAGSQALDRISEQAEEHPLATIWGCPRRRVPYRSRGLPELRRARRAHTRLKRPVRPAQQPADSDRNRDCCIWLLFDGSLHDVGKARRRVLRLTI